MFAKILHTFTSRVGIAGINFLIVILTAQYLGAAGRGEISLFIANVTVVLLFTGIVAGTGIANLAPRTNIYQLLLPSYVWCILSAAAITGLLRLLDQVPENYGWHLLVLSLLQAFFTANTTVLVGKEKVAQYNNLTFLQTLLTLVVLVAGFYLADSSSVWLYLVALYAAYGSTTLLSFLAMWQLSEKPEFSGFRTNVNTLLRLGTTAQFSNIITFLNYRLGYYFLNTLSDSKAVGIFSVGVSISEAIWMVSKSLALVQYARLVNTENLQEAEQLTSQLAKLGFWATTMAVLVLALFPPGVFRFIFGEEFGAVNEVIWSLGIGIIATGTGILFSHYFGARGKYHVNNWAALAGLLLTVPSCWLLIPKFGPVGAGLASTFSYVAANLFLYLKFRSETSFRLKHLLPEKADLVYLKRLLQKPKSA